MIYDIDAVSAYPTDLGFSKVEWRMDSFRGWAIQYAIVTDIKTGAKYTPIDQEFYLRHQPS